LSYCSWYLQLEELDLSLNKFKNGMNPSIGRLRHLKKLSLNYCEIQALPDSFWDLKEVGVLVQEIYQFQLELLQNNVYYHYHSRICFTNIFTDEWRVMHKALIVAKVHRCLCSLLQKKGFGNRKLKV